ncbi:MAG TPA: universal stress protein [Solirubrobacteraceae bacterium]|nr:universal stress protein [Solirubrobacteraceae bacterium]
MTEVLAALDSSPSAEPVLRTAVAFAPLLHATAVAVHVREDGLGIVAQAADSLNVELRVMIGRPVDQIIEASQAAGVAALVLGARGRHTGPRPAGHTALEVITRVRKPVVVVPAPVHPRTRFGRILVPLDGTHATSEALRETLEMAHAGDLEIVALHVHTPENAPAFADHEPYATEAWEAEFLARHVPVPHDRVSLVRRTGVPAEDIVALAGEADVDLVALAWSQSLRGRRARVVSQTLATSTVPVLLLPLAPVPGRRLPDARSGDREPGGRPRVASRTRP